MITPSTRKAQAMRLVEYAKRLKLLLARAATDRKEDGKDE